ncbi:MAG: lipopolysaccharide transport periplasmic protein LptA [Gammaproteobacteria bacterium]|nr:MAG: lipopolysaccharide transport periplasmic protein LptA [Gammaproteobacteria bacterium]
MSRYLSLLLFLLPLVSHGGDRDQPIHVEADRVEIDDKRGLSVYTGHVKVTQGRIVLEAAKVTLYHPHRRLQRVVAEGNPARYRQPLGKGELRAEAKRIDYRMKEQKLVLTGGARLWQQGNTFASELIEYDLARDIVHARGGKPGKGRVEVTIQPDR